MDAKLKRRHGGRPLKPIDKGQVIKLAQFGLPTRVIAHIIGCDESTLRYRFAADIEGARGQTISAAMQRKLMLAMAANGKLFDRAIPFNVMDKALDDWLAYMVPEYRKSRQKVDINVQQNTTNVNLDEKTLIAEFEELREELKQYPERKRIDARPVIEMEG